MKTSLLAGAALSALLIATNAAAQDAPAPDVADVTEVDTITVATRSPTSANKIGSQVTVLTKPDIDQRQVVSVGDLIAQTPGVHVTHNGGPGSTSSVFIRGAEGHHTVVIIDGVKLNDPASTQGGFNFGNLLVGDTARIEVLRGAQSTLWGSQAIGGVVNIITAEPKEGLNFDASAEAGERSTGYLRAGVDGANERGSFRLAGSLYTTAGFSAYSGGTEDDGYRNTGFSGRGRLNLTDTLSVEARAVYSDGRNEIDGFLTDSAEFGETEEFVAYLGLNGSLFDGRLRNRLAYALTDTDKAFVDPTFPAPGVTFSAEGTNKRWEYQGSFAIAQGWNATFGAETEDAEYFTGPDAFGTPPGGGQATTDSLYAQVQGTITPGLTLTGGLRRDDHETFGGQTVGQVAAAWSLNDGATVLRASWGQGFRAPGLFELFSDFGNLTLQPEETESWEASVAQRLWDGRVVLGAVYFQREAENEINFFSCTGAPDPLCTVNGVPRFGYYANIQATEAEGFELTGEYRPTGDFTLSANYTYTEAEFASGPNTGNQLIRRPKEMGNLAADYEWRNGLSTGVTVRYVGEVFANPANTVSLDPYTVVDLRLSYPVSETLELYGRLENAFDEDYQTVPNFNSPGRGAFIGFRARL